MEVSTEGRITAEFIRGPETPPSSVERAKEAVRRAHSYNSDINTYASALALGAVIELLEERLPRVEPEDIPEYGTATADAPTEAVPYGPDEFNLNFRITTPKNITAAEAFKIAKSMLPYGYEVKTLEHRFQEHGTQSNNYVYLDIIAVRLNPVPYGAVDA